jgi:hypothetical protein
MQHKIDLILGDWSYDGHSLTKLITIDSNLDKAEIKQAHTTGCKNLQIDFNHVCCEYRNNRIPITVWNKFTLAGFYFEENKIRETDFKIFSQYTEIYDFNLSNRARRPPPLGGG